jgi:hypothetical protein
MLNQSQPLPSNNINNLSKRVYDAEKCSLNLCICWYWSSSDMAVADDY